MATGILRIEPNLVAHHSKIFLNDVDISRWVMNCSIEMHLDSLTTVVLEMVPESIELPPEIEAVVIVYRDQDVGLGGEE
jgi:hypothetical protein